MAQMCVCACVCVRVCVERGGRDCVYECGQARDREGGRESVSATHCNTLQHTATHCNTLQHTATHKRGIGREGERVCVRMCLYVIVDYTHTHTWKGFGHLLSQDSISHLNISGERVCVL